MTIVPLEIDATVAVYLDQYLRSTVQSAIDGDVETAVAELKSAILAAAADDEHFYLIVGGGDPMLSENEHEQEAAAVEMAEAEPEDDMLRADHEDDSEIVEQVPPDEAETDSLRDYLGHEEA